MTDSKWEEIQESNVKFIQKQQFSTLLQLIANSIAVLHLHPTYFTGGHERPFISAALGTPTLTPALKWLETFGMPDFVKLYVDERQFRDIFYETKNIYSNDKTKQMIDQLHTQFGTNSYFRNIPVFWP